MKAVIQWLLRNYVELALTGFRHFVHVIGFLCNFYSTLYFLVCRLKPIRVQAVDEYGLAGRAGLRVGDTLLRVGFMHLMK